MAREARFTPKPNSRQASTTCLLAHGPDTTSCEKGHGCLNQSCTATATHACCAGPSPQDSVAILRSVRTVLKNVRFAFCRRCFSPGSQMWQNLQSTPLSQPFVCMKAQGLHWPSWCLAEPALGSSLAAAGSAARAARAACCRDGRRASACCRAGEGGDLCIVSTVLHSEPASWSAHPVPAAGTCLSPAANMASGAVEPKAALLISCSPG
mmetsp:Transcript_94815/g.268047  ORF Transcript_94815/g.268047 Transcript_94815/m.268047 type:complete len:209 (+) Transcript_94815:151-777(+)